MDRAVFIHNTLRDFVSHSAFRDTEYVCLTGFNLAMVIQMLQYDGDDLHELAEDIASIGKDVSIRLIPKIIPEEEQND